MKQLTKTSELRQKINNFLTNWHNGFILDYWWRRKYNIPFGSSRHREMNFIDMLIEYQEEIKIKEMIREKENPDDEYGESLVHQSQEEIDEDYDNLDLKNFD